jgi:GAF domain-containing protein
MDRLNEMGEQLQSCQTIAEACAISAQYIKRICPDSRGALYLINESKNFAEAVEMWGEPSFTQNIFDPLNCWAIRRGRQHLVDGLHPGLLCGHVTGPESGQYLCVPLLVNGEAIGILHLNHVYRTAGPDGEETRTRRIMNKKLKLSRPSQNISRLRYPI